MTVRVDDDGQRYSDKYCLRCEMPGPHYQVWPGDAVFQCERCKSPVSDEQEATGSDWLPDN